MKILVGAVLIVAALISSAAVGQTQSASTIVSIDDVDWSALNPARGDKSPQAGGLWGDRKAERASGFLVKFVDGFSSPPHIHNVTYRGVVIAGEVHNDDPKAESMWLPPGAFWTQPAGESHITSARGKTNIAYIEINEGPYLVKPADQAHDTGERPVNVDPSNLVWLGPQDAQWVAKGGGVEIAYLWGSPKPNELGGTFIKLPANFSGTLTSDATEFRAIVALGAVALGDRTLRPGSYFGGAKKTVQTLRAKEESVLYIRSNNRFDIQSNKSK